MALHTITTQKEFEEKVVKSNKVVLVDFWAAWCPPCRAMAPILQRVAEDLDSDVDVAKVNIEEGAENAQLAAEYDVRSIPNMPIFKNGKIVDHVVGMVPKEHLADMLQQIVKAA